MRLTQLNRNETNQTGLRETFPDLHRQVYAIGSHLDLKAGLLIDPSEVCCEIWSDSRFFRLLGALQRVISIHLLRSLYHHELLYISFDSVIQSITSRTKFPLFSIKTPSLIKKRARRGIETETILDFNLSSLSNYQMLVHSIYLETCLILIYTFDT